MGDGSEGSHIYELNKGLNVEAWGEKRHEPVYMTEQEEGKTQMKEAPVLCCLCAQIRHCIDAYACSKHVDN